MSIARRHHQARTLRAGAAAIAALALIALPLTVPAPAATAAPATECPHADDPVVAPDRVPVGNTTSRSRIKDRFPDLAYRHEIEKAVLCLTNNERAQRGIAILEWNMQLVDSAEKYGTDAGRLKWWVGSTPAETLEWHIHPETPRASGDDAKEAGTQVGSRVAAAKPCPTGQTLVQWSENTNWGTGTFATARAAVNAWMHSETHKANILDANAKLLGPGVVYGLAQPGAAPDQAGLFVQHFAACR